MTPTRPRPYGALLIVLFLTAPAGCGYTFTPLVRKGARRLHVPIVDNHTRRRDLAFPLTETLGRELRSAGYRLCSRERAEAVLTCALLEVGEEVTAEDPSGAVPQGRLTLVLEYVLRGRHGRELARGRVSESGETLFANGGGRQEAATRAGAELARSLVRALEPPPEGTYNPTNPDGGAPASGPGERRQDE